MARISLLLMGMSNLPQVAATAGAVAHDRAEA
jgi:hypothetical protein